MSVYLDEKVRSALREVIQGYYIKLSSRNDLTVENVIAMLEDDLKTLRLWDGEDILTKLIANNQKHGK